jgi:undecaprenyl-diphosphatase
VVPRGGWPRIRLCAKEERMSHFGYVEAGVIGLLQGVTELFPVSSLGHSVLLPALIGGSWARDLNVSTPESPYLAFIVALHVATAIALIVYFWRDWVRIVGGLLTSIRDRRVETPDQRLAWLLVLATIPVGICGLLLEHTFRTVLGKPTPAAAFLFVNGLVLFGAEQLRRRSVDGPPARPRHRAPASVTRSAAVVGSASMAGSTAVAGSTALDAAPAGGRSPSAGRSPAGPVPAVDPDVAADRRLSGLRVVDALTIGGAQIAALAPGISRSGVTMASGLLRGLSHEDAARFAFLLATPVILAAGLLKIPDLMGPLGDGVRGQAAFGAVMSGLAAYGSVRFLSRWFETRTLTPFACYCLVAGGLCFIRFAIF